MRRFWLFLLGIGLCLLAEAVGHVLLPWGKLNIIESVNTVCKQDEELLWKQRPGLDIFFQGKRVRTDDLGLRCGHRIKKDNAFRIFCMGGSSTFGWGVEENEVYAAQLENMLSNRAAGRDIQVINAGQIGYTTTQGNVFFEKVIFGLDPDIITYSYVLNDIDMIRFFRRSKGSDSDLLGISDRNMIDILEEFFSDKRVYFLFKRFAGQLIRTDKRLEALLYKNKYESSWVRVTEEQYSQNIKDIASICRQKGIRLILIVMPVNLELPQISAGTDGVKLSEEYYSLGLESFREKDYGQAQELFKKALDYQVFKCNQKGYAYQDIMRRIAAEEGIMVLDAQALFDSASGKGADLFNGPEDRIHPNAMGHRLIAAGLYDLLAGKIFEENR